MTWQTVQYKLTSSFPMIQHNGQTANPLNKWAKLLKQTSSKRSKTDADYEEMARIEFMASLYMNEQGPVIPANMIDAMLINAAKKSKQGVEAKSSVFCHAHAALDYDGPRTAAGLWADERFRHQALVRVNMARILRTRAVFNEWSAVVELQVEDSVVDPVRVDDWMRVAGAQIGLGDWRPQHGRFEAARIG